MSIGANLRPQTILTWCRNHNPLKTHPWENNADFVAHIKRTAEQWAENANFLSVVFVGTKESFGIYSDMCALHARRSVSLR